MNRKYPSLLARIIAQSIMQDCPVSSLKGKCYVWTGYRDNKNYGRITIREELGPRGRQVHRVAWKEIKGELPPPGHTLDHLCFNEPCWNPDHLEPVTDVENTKRARARQILISAGIIRAMPKVRWARKTGQASVHEA